jgi:hypothetical protein
MQFQHHNITSDKWSDQNNERFYHVKKSYCLHDWQTIFIILFSSFWNVDLQFTCSAVNTQLNHRRIFLFSTPCGLGSLLCMRTINCKPHWLAICCLSRIFYSWKKVIVCMIDRQYSSYCFLASEMSIGKKIKYSRQAAYSQSMGFQSFNHLINISHTNQFWFQRLLWHW